MPIRTQRLAVAASRATDSSILEITEADDGRRAIELTRERPFDLVLLDVTMPDLDGLDVLKKIRQCPATEPKS